MSNRCPMLGWVALLPVLAAGCGGGDEPARKPVFPVQGEVFVNGKPAAGAMVSFHPLGDPNPRALRSHARAAADGTFKLTTYVSEDGAPEGDYAVTVYWPGPKPKGANPDDDEQLPPDLLKGRFAAPAKTVLRAKTRARPTRLPRVDLGERVVLESKEYVLEEK